MAHFFAMSALSPLAVEARRLDADRFLCALAAPAPMREGLFALLAFDGDLARIRGRAKEPALRHLRLAWWRQTLEAILEGHPPPRQPVAEALGAAIGRHNLSGALFERLVDGRESDLADEAPADAEFLAAATGGTLARLMLEVLDVREGPAVDAAQLVGTAYALTEQLRAGRAPADVGEVARHRLVEARHLLPRPPKVALPVLLPAVFVDERLRRPERRERGAWPVIRLVLAAWRHRF